MHLCIGAHQGLKNETPSELARIRPCKRATFVRSFSQGCLPGSWQLQLFNGADESGFLNVLQTIADSGKCPAEEKLDLFNGRWNRSVDPVFKEFAY